MQSEQTETSVETSKKKLLIDTTFLFDQYAMRGIGRYGKEVLKRLLDIVTDDKQWELHFIGFLNLQQNLIQLGISQFTIEQCIEKIKFHSIGEPYLSSTGNIRKWLRFFKPVVEEVKPDIYYSVNFERGTPSVDFFKKRLSWHPKTIVMAHDAIPIVTNKYSSKSPLHNILKGAFYKFMFTGIKNADIVVTNSDFSKSDLIKYANVKEEKIHTIYLGIDESFFRHNLDKEDEERTLDLFGLKDTKYYFYDSGLEANKGIDELIEIAKCLFENKDLPQTLVITGGDFYKGRGKAIKYRKHLGKLFLSKATKIGILDNIVVTDRIPDETLITLLFNATTYINLASYEGFSFGPLQAMAAEIPAIASNSSCTPEITDGGALLIDPKDTANSCRRIQEYLVNKEELEKYKQKGKDISKRYNWDTTVEKTWDLIKKL